MIETDMKIKTTDNPSIDRLIIEHAELMSAYDITHLPDGIGSVLKRKESNTEGSTDVLLSDYDDTLAAILEAKGIRDSKIRHFFEENGFLFSDEQHLKLVITADQVARWRESEDEEPTYHHNFHMKAFSFALKRLEGEEFDEVVESLKLQKSDIQQTLPHAEVERIFNETSLSPQVYEEVVDVISSFANDEEHPTRIGILSLGEPYYQLKKIIRFIEAHPELPIDFIMLTTIEKGKYLEAIDQHIPSFFEVHNIKGIIMLDDNPDQLDSMSRSAQNISSDISVHPIQLVRDGIKKHKNTGVHNHIQLIDFRHQDAKDNCIKAIHGKRKGFVRNEDTEKTLKAS